jgi:WD40 repeat protein/transcriptional regulator with XRE-family HTH domain
VDTRQRAQLFRDLLLRHRGRSGLTQQQLAERASVHWRSVQDWEKGAKYPSPRRLESLIRVLLDAHGLTPGEEMVEAEALWAATERESSRIRAPFDHAWFAAVLAEGRSTPGLVGPAPEHVAPRLVARAAGAELAERRHDWGEAPDALGLVGRAHELQTLRNWILDEGVRLLAILGVAGVGKTSLAANMSREVAPRFDRLYWRSLRDAPPTHEWLAGAIAFLSDQRLAPPSTESEQRMLLLQLLRERRCLLVLDHFRSVLEPGVAEATYRPGLEGYGRLLQVLGLATHQSCLVLTSREEPAELTIAAGQTVRSFVLGGLGPEDVRMLLAAKELVGTSQQWAELTARFGGDALALKVVGQTIRELFNGDLGSFLEEHAAGRSSVFGGIRGLLSEQIERGSAAEQRVLRVLAVEREPMGLSKLLQRVGPRIGRGIVLNALEALRRRSLVERAEVARAATFTLQPVVLEYVTDRLVEDAADEIAGGQPVHIVQQALILAQARDYVRQTQERLIGVPILQSLNDQLGEDRTDQQLRGLLASWRDRPPDVQGYGPGNVVNLLRLQKGNLRGLDLSRLAIRQAYLADVEAQDASLAGADLADTVLAEAFNFPTSVALSADGARLVAGTSDGEIWLWQLPDRRPLLAVRAEGGPIWALAMSTEGDSLVSGGADGKVRLWEASSGRPLVTLEGHIGEVRGVAVTPDGRLVVSGGADGTVRLWESSSGQAVVTLQGHTGEVRGVAVTADGRLVVSGGADGTVRLWEASSGQPLVTLESHTGEVRGVAVTADGRLVVSAGADGTVRLWAAGTGQPLASLAGHSGVVWAVALSLDGRFVASGGTDRTVRIWDVDTARPVAALEGHAGMTYGVALSSNGQLLASAGTDGTVRLWEANIGKPAATLRGRSDAVRGVALSASGHFVASGDLARTVRVWDVRSGDLLVALEGHASGVTGVALSADGRLVASGGEDGTVRVWDVATGRTRAVLEGHTGLAWCVALSADGKLVASGGSDRTVRVWEVETGHALALLDGHAGAVRGVALSADGGLVASGSVDRTLRLWETRSGRLMATLEGHMGMVWGVALAAGAQLVASSCDDGVIRTWDLSTRQLIAAVQGHSGPVSGVALSADGRLLASGGQDGKVRVWETATGQPVTTLDGHTGVVWGVAVSADGHLVASGSFDGTVKVWETTVGSAPHTFRADRRYERLDITGLRGVTAAQRAALLALGATDGRME